LTAIARIDWAHNSERERSKQAPQGDAFIVTTSGKRASFCTDGKTFHGSYNARKRVSAQVWLKFFFGILGCVLANNIASWQIKQD
jgi:hypothetical protein